MNTILTVGVFWETDLNKYNCQIMYFFFSSHSFEDKKVVCLATSLFPAALGRNQTLKYLKEKCEKSANQ